MSIDSCLDNDNGSIWTDMPWLRRTLVFLFLGPLLGVFELWAFAAALGGLGQYLSFVMGVVFGVCMLASAVMGIIDSLLARTWPIAGRAPLTAVICALLVMVPPAALFGPFALVVSMAVGAVAALNMAVCSWLSDNDRHARAGLGAPVPSRDYLTRPLNGSFTLAQPRGHLMMAP